MPKVTIDERGVVETKGSGIVVKVPFDSSPKQAVNALTAASTLTVGGVYTVSGNAAVTTVMPLASAVPGATFIFRALSAHAHIFTGSQETVGTQVFAGMAGATPANLGSSLALAAVVGSSAAVVSDGKSFLVMAASGTCVLAGL